MFAVGIDAGAENLKIVVLNQEQRYDLLLQCGNYSTRSIAEQAFVEVIKRAGISKESIKNVVATGLGKNDIPFANFTAPDSVCIAKAINKLYPYVKMVIDIGAHKTLALKCKDGIVSAMATNDKCAGGAGMLINAIADIMSIPVKDSGDLSLSSDSPVEVLNTCAVFVESDVISQIHMGKEIGDILYGVFRGLTSRIYQTISKLGVGTPLAVVGGVANNKGVIRALQEELSSNVFVPLKPEFIGAYGAAIIAGEKG